MNVIDLSTEISGLQFSSPLMTASGTAGYGKEFLQAPCPSLGAFVTKGISLKPRKGNPPPRVCETSCGLLNAIGLENIGLEAFLNEILPFFSGENPPLIVNIFGESTQEIVEIASRLSKHQAVKALELNVSCPNVRAGGIAFGKDARILSALIRDVKSKASQPVWVKLTPSVNDIAVIAKAAEEAGADAITVANSYTGIAVDIEREEYCLGNITGGLTGPAIKPLSQYAVWQVVKEVRVPVIASGGCASARDALEYFLLGARAVQIGTMALVNPSIFDEILDGLEEFFKRRGIPSLNNWIGRLK